MAFNSASFVLAVPGTLSLWLYSTEDNLASNQVSTEATDYFKLANSATREGGFLGVRKGDIILASNSASKQVTSFGVTYASTEGNSASITAQTNNT